jgi:hypothetical protein
MSIGCSCVIIRISESQRIYQYSVLLGGPGLEKLRLSPWRLNYIQKKVGRELGCRVGGPPRTNKF